MYEAIIVILLIGTLASDDRWHLAFSAAQYPNLTKDEAIKLMRNDFVGVNPANKLGVRL